MIQKNRWADQVKAALQNKDGKLSLVTRRMEAFRYMVDRKVTPYSFKLVNGHIEVMVMKWDSIAGEFDTERLCRVNHYSKRLMSMIADDVGESD